MFYTAFLNIESPAGSTRKPVAGKSLVMRINFIKTFSLNDKDWIIKLLEIFTDVALSEIIVSGHGRASVWARPAGRALRPG
jgi:hypothetical protein